ncbi:transposase [Paraburkholderia hayleyella]|uniref:transposase n=1 Tax=Paraburkholderia hayleyella TaxID=2152889 RepID=UPI0012924F7C
MKTSKLTEAQIAFALKQAELGTKVEEVCRKLGISEAELLQLEEEVRWRRAVRASQNAPVGRREHEAQALGCRSESGQGHAAGWSVKKALKPSRKRTLIDELRDRYRASLTKVCALFCMSRSLYGYQSVTRDSPALLARIKEIAATRVHYGYRRVHVMLQTTNGSIDSIKPRAYRCGISGQSETNQRGCANPRASLRPSMRYGAWTSSPTHCLTVDTYVF